MYISVYIYIYMYISVYIYTYTADGAEGREIVDAVPLYMYPYRSLLTPYRSLIGLRRCGTFVYVSL